MKNNTVKSIEFIKGNLRATLFVKESAQDGKEYFIVETVLGRKEYKVFMNALKYLKSEGYDYVVY